MSILKKITLLLMIVSLPAMIFAQGKTTLMRSEGRIYVVVAVMVTILIGLVLYMVRVDRKISKIEKDNI